MKQRLNICLTQEEVETLDEMTKVHTLSKSAMLGKLITQELHITQPVQIQNEYTPEGINRQDLVEEINGLLVNLKKTDKSKVCNSYTLVEQLQSSQKAFETKVLSKLKEIKELIEDVSPSGDGSGYIP